MTNATHLHVWGALERSHFAGTVHRKCQVAGCDFVLALEEEPHVFVPDEELGAKVCGYCGVQKKHHPVDVWPEDEEG